MLHYTAALLTVIGERIRKVRNILQNRTAVSLLSIFITSVVIFLMTGALYFRNEVIITDGEDTFRIFTMQTSPENILNEQGIVLSELDSFSFDGFDSIEGSVATLAITRSHTVGIMVDGINFRTKAFAGESVSEVLYRQGIKIGEHDLVTPDLNKIVDGPEVIKVARSFYVTLKIDGVEMTLPVVPDGVSTVSDVLLRKGIELKEENVLTENLHTLAYPGMEAAISTIRYNEREVVNPIPYKTIEIPSNLLAIGDIEVLNEGEDGAEKVIVREKIIDGVIHEIEIIYTEILKQPVDKVQNIGMALAAPYSMRDFEEIELVDGRPVNYEFKISGRASAYTASATAGTASRRPLEIGTVAVNPNVIPYGSLVYIVTQDGSIVYGAAIAADTGSFIHNSNIVVDVFKGTHDFIHLAREWGIRNVDVYVINTGLY